MNKLDNKLVIKQKQEIKKEKTESKHSYDKNALNIFLKQYYTKDQNLWTHTTLGPCIDDDGTYINSKQELIDILHDVRFVHKKPVFLSERPQQHTLLKADFDFKYNLNHELKRTHTLEIIKQTVELYNSILWNI